MIESMSNDNNFRILEGEHRMGKKFKAISKLR